MGGKTQQRVAGNAKPTNSGRIRGLLMSQQLATGNVITFSALSARNQSSKTPTEADKSAPAYDIAQESSASEQLPAPSHTEPSEATSSPVQIAATIATPTKDNYKLVLKRVGNRELYTRVKLTDDDAHQRESAVELSIAGVKKPSYLTDDTTGAKQDSQATENSTINQEQKGALDDDGALEDDDGRGGDSEVHAEFPDDNLSFDQLLAQMEGAKMLVEQSPRVENLHELNETASEHEVMLLSTFKILLRKFSNDLSIEDWDLIVGSLKKWVSWISKSHHPLKESHRANFCAKIFTFIHQLIVYAGKMQREIGGNLDENPMMESLLDDWTNFGSSSMFLDLISLYLKLITSEKSSSSDHQIADSSDQTILGPMIEALAQIIVTVDPRVVLSHHKLMDYLDARVEFDFEYKTPKNSMFCTLDEKKFKSFLAVCGLLRSNSRVILVTAHAILSKVMGSICENAQSSTLIADQETVEDALIYPPAALMAVLTSRDSIMSALLSDYRVGDVSVAMDPSTDAYACTLAYLFTWDLVIQFIVGVNKEIGQCMIHSLKKPGLLQRLLDTIFMLLPPLDDRHSLQVKFEPSADQEPTSAGENWSIKQFLRSPLKTTIKRPVNDIELVALHIYFSVALHMPVTVRKWYNNNANKRLCNLVNEYTVKHISQVICSIEMDSVLEKCQERAQGNDQSNKLIIKARPTAKEVYAMYTRDEFKMELTIKLPLNYPLGSVQIDGGKRVGVTDVKWRSWLLQLTTFLSHQNGPILDGIDLWRKNIDKRFEGVEKCTICFSILHSNYQLPKKRCQTCTNMFHNVCLYKWFQSSGNSTCPLCRNPW